ncbi:MAG: hypothetical protein M1832_005540 [Thelocarpon impressellum]|nr:MAG: hypothetical protein M1832_005540 [Thelocarpon impressellum]
MAAPTGDGLNGAYGASNPSDSNHSSTGPASSTAGPHKSNILNKMDPRVDSDLDGSKTTGGSHAVKPSQSTVASHGNTGGSATDGYSTNSSLAADEPPPRSVHDRGNVPTAGQGVSGRNFGDFTANGDSDPYHPADFAVSRKAGVTPAGTSHVTTDPRIDHPGSGHTTGPLTSGLQRESTRTSGSGRARESQKGVASHVPKTGMHEAPTESHAIAVADHEYKGTAQDVRDVTEVEDLGWKEHPDEIPRPLVGGLPNEQLWTLVRRFNKQMYHVKAIDEAPPGGLDLNIAADEEFSPDKLRSNVERLYMTVIIGMASFGKHIVRIRSWRETRRTAAFCAAYFVAWFFNFIMPLSFSMIMLLVVYPPSRPFLFPPAPLGLVDGSTGGAKKPMAGMLGSHDSMTGAAEKHQGEAVEQEAHNFVTGLAAIGLSSATGKHPANETHKEGGAIDSAVPDPTDMATKVTEAKDNTSGDRAVVSHDKTKQPMEQAMWTKTRPVMHILANIADTWERFANALSPTAPYPKSSARYRLGALVVPMVLVALLTSSAVFVKMTTFITGAAFFSDPIMARGLKLLNEKVPNWQEYLDPRNNVLKGVPTNAQLTLTLLRIGEANKAPLPPPPQTAQPPFSKPPKLDGDDVPIDVTHEEVQDAIHPDAETAQEIEETKAKEPAKKGKAGARILGFFKRTTKVGVEATLGTDRLKAAAGSGHAKNRLGVLPDPKVNNLTGPVEFKARYGGKKGYAYIRTSDSPPSLHYTHDVAAVEAGAERPEPAFSVPLATIRELRKLGGLGWKVKMVVGWAMDREVADGLEIVDDSGRKWTLTAIPLREELFNRLVAVGGQKWESW